MTGMPTPIAESNVIGRHGRVGTDVLPREFEIAPAYDQAFVEQGMAIIAVAETARIDFVESTGMKPTAEKPAEDPGFYL